MVELTLALHRVFDSPRDRILWDTGHQAYVHKMLTGRAGQFDTLRQEGGLSGYPSRAESEHDVIENSHASTALSYADGLAKAYQLRGERPHGGRRRRRRRADRRHGLGGAQQHRGATTCRLVIVVNDNGRSYAPTIGGLAAHLATLRTTPGYEHAPRPRQGRPDHGPRWSALRSTTPCTASRRASRTSCRRRACSRTSA